MTLRTPAYLFLDLDGVLQTPALGDFIEMEHLPVLQDWLRRHPEVYVVLASTHREGMVLSQVQAWFDPDLASKVIGMTAVTATSRAYGGRQAEIEAWMQANAASDARWCALDDETLLFKPGCPWFVFVHPWTGLLPEHLEQVERHLGLGAAPAGAEDELAVEGQGLRPLFTKEEQAHLKQGRLDVPKKGTPARAPSAPSKPATASAPSWWERLFGWLD